MPAKPRGHRQRDRRQAVWESGGENRNGTWKRKEKAESVLKDKQEVPKQGFLRQKVTISKNKILPDFMIHFWK
jgi:hypothetical protein